MCNLGSSLPPALHCGALCCLKPHSQSAQSRRCCSAGTGSARQPWPRAVPSVLGQLSSALQRLLPWLFPSPGLCPALQRSLPVSPPRDSDQCPQHCPLPWVSPHLVEMCGVCQTLQGPTLGVLLWHRTNPGSAGLCSGLQGVLDVGGLNFTVPR